MAERRRPRREQTREQIIDAAGAVFDESGFENASIDRIADRAGLTKGAVYSSFDGKDELFRTVVERRVAERIHRATDVDPQLSKVESIRQVGRTLTAATGDDLGWHAAFFEYWVQVARRPDLHASFVQQRSGAREAIATVLRDHAQRGDIKLTLSADRTATLILALSNGLAIESLADAVDTELFADALAPFLRPSHQGD